MSRPRKLDPALVPALRRAVAAGMSRKDICRRFGIGRTTLWEALMGQGKGVSEHLSGVSEHRSHCDGFEAPGSLGTSASAAFAMGGVEVLGGFFAPKAPAAPAPPPPPPTTEDPSVEAERQKQVQIAANAKGRAATLLTGGQGDTSQAPLGKASLLGA